MACRRLGMTGSEQRADPGAGTTTPTEPAARATPVGSVTDSWVTEVWITVPNMYS
jgi:hypothetical protein